MGQAAVLLIMALFYAGRRYLAVLVLIALLWALIVSRRPDLKMPSR